MSIKTLTNTFNQLSTVEQTAHLAAWAFCLTIDARDTYIPGTEGIADPARLRRFNECQHRLTCYLAALLRNDRTPDEVFIQYLAATAKDLHAGLLLSKMAEFATAADSNPPRRERKAG